MRAVTAKGAISQKTGPRVRWCFAKTYFTRKSCDDSVMEQHVQHTKIIIARVLPLSSLLPVVRGRRYSEERR